MGYYIGLFFVTPDNPCGYYEGDKWNPCDIEVPRRPNHGDVWAGPSWVPGPPAGPDVAHIVARSRVQALQDLARRCSSSNPGKAIALYLKAQGILNP